MSVLDRLVAWRRDLARRAEEARKGRARPVGQFKRLEPLPKKLGYAAIRKRVEARKFLRDLARGDS